MSDVACSYQNEDVFEEGYIEEPLYEIIEGEKEYMSPSAPPKHNYIVSNLCFLFGKYVWDNNYRIFTDSMDVHLPDGKNVFQPDFSVVCDLSIIKPKAVYGSPDFVVEILSRSTMDKDRGKKMKVYERNGIKEYWIVNYWAKTIEVYHLIEGNYMLDYTYQVYQPYELEDLTEEELAQIRDKIKLSIFDDLFIDVHDVFHNIE